MPAEVDEAFKGNIGTGILEGSTLFVRYRY
jgi:hypothetical protein